jgi:hypothetical protein
VFIQRDGLQIQDGSLRKFRCNLKSSQQSLVLGCFPAIALECFSRASANSTGKTGVAERKQRGLITRYGISNYPVNHACGHRGNSHRNPAAGFFAARPIPAYDSHI